jgi:hypothetical protein
MPADGQERRDIPRKSGQSGDKAPFADGDKLVRGGQAAEPGPGFDLAMPAYLHEIAQNGVIFDRAVVSDVHVDHEEIVVSDSRMFVRIHTRMDSHMLVHLVPVAYYESADFGASVQTHDLRFAADHTAGKEAILPADPDIFANDHVCLDYRTGTDRDATVDDGIGPDYYIVGQLSIFVDYRTWMYLSHVTS